MNEENKNFEFSQVMSMLENMNDGIKLIAEGHQVLERKMDILSEKVDLLVEDMDYVKGALVDNKDRFKDAEIRLNKLETAVLAKA